jgi:hypothetical protein
VLTYANLASCAQPTFGVAKQEHPFYLTQGDIEGFASIYACLSK